MRRRRLTILLVEDCEDDILIARRALSEVAPDGHRLFVVRDGLEALDYLRRAGAYGRDEPAPRPDVILLDVNMPRLDGFGVLREVKSDSSLRVVPIVMLTTSTAEWDVRRAYDLGANSYVVKPESFRQTVRVLGALCDYWGNVVALA
jgi:CheY-like chemotaxis protein